MRTTHEIAARDESPIDFTTPASIAELAGLSAPAGESRRAESGDAPRAHSHGTAAGVEVVEAFTKFLPLPPYAQAHLREFPFKPPSNVKDCSFWYEGTFDPFGPHHLEIFLRTMELGFERAVLAIVYQNPYKPTSLPYHHRYAMAKRTLEDAGLTVVNDPQKKGVCIFEPQQESQFHLRRMEVLFGRNNYVLIGPDNFQRALEANVLWVHPAEIRENPRAADFFGFKSMMDNIPGFKRTVLVYPRLHDLHSTDIRQGKVAVPRSVADYVAEHGLYKPETVEPTKVVGPALQFAKAKSTVHKELSHEEVLWRSDLGHRIALQLSKHGLLSEAVRFAVDQTLGGMDHSELSEIGQTLASDMTDGSRVETITAARSATEISTGYLRPRPTLQKLRSQVIDAALGQSLETEGAENVHAAHRAGKRLIFVGNQNGWGSLTLLPLALKQNRLGRIADQTTFVVSDDLFLSTFAQRFIGGSLGRIGLPPSMERGGEQERAETVAMRHGLRRLFKDSAIALFPESSGAQTRMGAGIAAFAPTFIKALREFCTSQSDQGREPIVIVPWAQSGGDVLSSGRGIHFSEDAPPFVRFGAPIDAADLIGIAETGEFEVAAHVVGKAVAELLPVERRGVYGTWPEHLTGDQEGRSQISEQDLADIARATHILGAIQRVEKPST